MGKYSFTLDEIEAFWVADLLDHDTSDKKEKQLNSYKNQYSLQHKYKDGELDVEGDWQRRKAGMNGNMRNVFLNRRKFTEDGAPIHNQTVNLNSNDAADRVATALKWLTDGYDEEVYCQPVGNGSLKEHKMRLISFALEYAGDHNDEQHAFRDFNKVTKIYMVRAKRVVTLKVNLCQSKLNADVVEALQNSTIGYEFTACEAAAVQWRLYDHGLALSIIDATALPEAPFCPSLIQSRLQHTVDNGPLKLVEAGLKANVWAFSFDGAYENRPTPAQQYDINKAHQAFYYTALSFHRVTSRLAVYTSFDQPSITSGQKLCDSPHLNFINGISPASEDVDGRRLSLINLAWCYTAKTISRHNTMKVEFNAVVLEEIEVILAGGNTHTINVYRVDCRNPKTTPVSSTEQWIRIDKSHKVSNGGPYIYSTEMMRVLKNVDRSVYLWQPNQRENFDDLSQAKKLCVIDGEWCGVVAISTVGPADVQTNLRKEYNLLAKLSSIYKLQLDPSDCICVL